ncbi:MAG: hypothetical protein ACOX5S_00710 [Patescibacteria group bacterium]
MPPPTIILTLFCHPDSFHRHPDESQDRRFSFFKVDPDSSRRHSDESQNLF